MSDRNQTNPDDANRDRRMEAVIADYIRACETGAAPDRQAILDGHPEFANDLRQFFVQHDHMNQLVEPIREFADDQFQSVGPGQQISYVGNYELLEEIARGGMGIVYKARQSMPKRFVAVKLILKGRLATDEDVKRFKAEAQAAGGLQHPNIVAIHEVGEHDGWHYFSMDYVSGRDLSAVLREKVLSPRQAATYVRQMAEAIHYAHQQGTLHRDLKPSNVMIDNDDHVRITDFGLAMRVDEHSDLTKTGQPLGTPSYMPPEQAQGKRRLLGPGSDVYSMGAVLYECLTGRPPFRADSFAETIQQVIHVDAPSPRLLNPAVPLDLETICLKSLEKEPHRRYSTAQLLADDLGRFLAGESILARATRPWERGAKWVRRHPAPAALTLVSTVATLAIVMVLVSQTYNTRLKALNESLGTLNENLKTTNHDLETKSVELETTMDALKAEKGESDRQRARARDAEAKARRVLYAAQMAQVETARQQNQPDRVVSLLRSVIPEDEHQEDPRGFEWNHLWRLYQGEESRLRGHKGAVRAVAFSPDDRLLASAGDDFIIKLWDITTGHEQFELKGHTSRVTGVSFSPTGKRLATCSADMTVRVWDIEARVELHCLNGHEGAVTSVAFSPDDQHIVSGSDDKSVCLWDSITGHRVRSKSFTNSVSGVAFSPDGNQVACATQQEKQKVPTTSVVWHVFTDLTITMNGDRASQSSVAFSPDGITIVNADEGTQNGKPRIVISQVGGIGDTKIVGEHDSRIGRVVFSPDGKRLASCSFDRTVKVWDLASHDVVTLHEQSSVYSVAFSPDGLRLATASGDGNVKLWSMKGIGSNVRSFQTGPMNNVSFSPDGARIAGVNVDTPGTVIIWNVYSGSERLRLPVIPAGKSPQNVRVQWSPDGRFLAYNPEVWDAVTGRIVVPSVGHDRVSKLIHSGWNSHKAAFTTDSSLLATADNREGVRIFNTFNGEIKTTFSAAQPWATCVTFSPDNKFLVGGFSSIGRSRSGAVKMWNVETGSDGVTLEEAFYLSVADLAYSPDGTRLAAAIGDQQSRRNSALPGEVVVWDTQTGVSLQRLPHRSCVYAVSFSPDGKRLATASGFRDRTPGEVKIWDMITGQEVCSCIGHIGEVYGVAFSPCGRRLATSSRDGTVKFWDGTPLAETPSKFPPGEIN